MTSSEMVRNALSVAGKTQTELATFMGWSKQNLSARLRNNTLTLDETIKALSFVGYTVKMVDDNGRKLPDLGNSLSPRVVSMVDGTIYDTRKAESLCDNRAVLSSDMYTELFRDSTKGYFLVYYELWEDGHSKISPVSLEAAQRFWIRFSKGPDEEFK